GGSRGGGGGAEVPNKKNGGATSSKFHGFPFPNYEKGVVAGFCFRNHPQFFFFLKKYPRHKGRGYAFGRIHGQPRSRAVILLQVVGDCLGISVVDWRTESLDHFCDLGVPQRRVRKWRVHRDVVETMTGLAIGLDLLETRRFFQLNRLFVSAYRKRNQRGCRGDDECPHDPTLCVQRDALHHVVVVAGRIKDEFSRLTLPKLIGGVHHHSV